ncbi:hypothetical protein GA0070609_4434 [Micromonospora echinaurantiaca]|uniref:Uncharacterized protein n=1 Tax=Micromonospora echinaurantiaca TaxID=47857 RepID=A0A1C5JGH7_9ACTN|nr:hypothetical protein [Micromonospora echinaurantiaca]SCG69662.1 hypothetical protein GA0070609_4434 [Micromonospora echinaurantiaca]
MSIEDEDGVIYPDNRLMSLGCETADRIANTDSRRVTVTADEAQAVNYFLVWGVGYCNECPPEVTLQWRGKRHRDGSRDITGKQLAAMRDYWRRNLAMIIAVGTGVAR